MEIKRVKTLTFTHSVNYGALLQAYALSNYVKSLGNECDVIQYRNPAMKYSQVSGIKKVRSIVWTTFFLPFFRRKERKQKTQQFKKNFLGQEGLNYCSCDELMALNDKTDVFIVGSDQVWSIRNNANDPAFLLAFTDKKKVAYAASFGTNDVPKDYLFENRKLFESFDAISVREESGAKALASNINVLAPVVCDPVFLLEKEEWIAKLRLQDRTHEKYVLCYIMPGNREVVAHIYKIAKQIASEICASVIVVGEKPYKKNHDVFLYDHDCGPVEFVDYIKNAEYVVTNSFHGTAFSVVFRKNFYTVMKNDSRSRNTRMENLLKNIGLDDRKIYAMNGEITALPVDYSKSEKPLKEMIEKSKTFLADAIK